MQTEKLTGSIEENNSPEKAVSPELQAQLGASANLAHAIEPVPAWQTYIDTLSDDQILDGDFDPEKLNCTAAEFGVNSDDYPIFDRQSTLHPNWDDNSSIRWNIDRTLSMYINFTAGTISELDGSTGPKADHVIYLDKSARPASWLVNQFWDDFAAKDPKTGQTTERPEESFLNIDRIPWFQRVGLDVDSNMYFTDDSGEHRKANFNDFLRAVKKNPPLQEIAAIRALYFPEGNTSDDVDTIMQHPSPLEGKNLVIIDEVSDTGSTARVAKYLIERAFPEANSVSTHIFANFGEKRNSSGDHQMLGAPVWYPRDHSYEYGRGVLDLNPSYWNDVYTADPTPVNYAKMRAGFVLSRPMDLDSEPGQESKELMREITQMGQDYRAG